MIVCALKLTIYFIFFNTEIEINTLKFLKICLTFYHLQVTLFIIQLFSTTSYLYFFLLSFFLFDSQCNAGSSLWLPVQCWGFSFSLDRKLSVCKKLRCISRRFVCGLIGAFRLYSRVYPPPLFQLILLSIR